MSEDNDEIKKDKVPMKSIIDHAKFWDLPDWPSRMEWHGSEGMRHFQIVCALAILFMSVGNFVRNGRIDELRQDLDTLRRHHDELHDQADANFRTIRDLRENDVRTINEGFAQAWIMMTNSIPLGTAEAVMKSLQIRLRDVEDHMLRDHEMRLNALERRPR